MIVNVESNADGVLVKGEMKDEECVLTNPLFVPRSALLGEKLVLLEGEEEEKAEEDEEEDEEVENESLGIPAMRLVVVVAVSMVGVVGCLAECAASSW